MVDQSWHRKTASLNKLSGPILKNEVAIHDRYEQFSYESFFFTTVAKVVLQLGRELRRSADFVRHETPAVTFSYFDP